MASYNEVKRANRAGAFGYWIGAGFEGQGLVRAAVQGLIKFGFEKLNLNKVLIGCATGNLRSQKIPESLGFTYEGTLRQNEWLYDHFVDHKIYSLLKSEWKPS